MNNTKNEANRTVRNLKAQPKTVFNMYSRKEVPELRLRGEWLKNMGIMPGMMVTVRAVGGGIFIERK